MTTPETLRKAEPLDPYEAAKLVIDLYDKGKSRWKEYEPNISKENCIAMARELLNMKKTYLEETYLV
jgi:hypothetical protein